MRNAHSRQTYILCSLHYRKQWLVWRQDTAVRCDASVVRLSFVIQCLWSQSHSFSAHRMKYSLIRHTKFVCNKKNRETIAQLQLWHTSRQTKMMTNLFDRFRPAHMAHDKFHLSRLILFQHIQCTRLHTVHRTFGWSMLTIELAAVVLTLKALRCIFKSSKLICWLRLKMFFFLVLR